MAIGTILSELVVMRIRMAIGAIPVRQASELLEFQSVPRTVFMAFFACNFLVFAGQLKFSHSMPEFYCWFKGIRSMAILAR